ncbi:MAG: hypothetical protein GQ570_10475 [Helicobacteraceae bacterium]|nr:hypothetical protein [Helicobacteraceae bacterium]
MQTKEQLLDDIEKLLNSYEDSSITTINPDILKFMDEESLKGIISSLLDQKEKTLETNAEWIEQFKSEK